MDMWLLLVLLCASTPSVFGYGSETYRCPSSIPINKFVRTLGDKCYQFVRNELSWFAAKEDCQRKGGNLVTITSRSIQNFVMRSFNEFHWPYRGVWIGATDLSSEMNWRWVTGKSITYNNWAPGQPSCHIFCFEDCAQLRIDDGGRWHDYKCNWIDDYSYICEFPLKPKSTTTTTTTTSTTTTRTTTTTSASTTTTTTASTTTASTTTANSTVNETLVMGKPDVKVVMHGNSRMSQMKHTEVVESNTGTVIGLVLALICSLMLCLCFAVIILKRRNRKHAEEEPSVFFSNPFYADTRAPLNPSADSNDDFIDSSCCAAVVGGASFPSPSQAPTPVKRPLFGTPVPKRFEKGYKPPPPIRDYGDDLTTQKVPFAALDSGEYEGAVGGDDLVDNHYDYSTGENFYESVDNVRLAIQQNALNEEQEDRYVPFQFDHTPPAPPRPRQ